MSSHFLGFFSVRSSTQQDEPWHPSKMYYVWQGKWCCNKCLINVYYCQHISLQSNLWPNRFAVFVSDRLMSGHQGLCISRELRASPPSSTFMFRKPHDIVRGTQPLSHSFMSLIENLLYTDYARFSSGRLAMSEHMYAFIHSINTFLSLS